MKKHWIEVCFKDVVDKVSTVKYKLKQKEYSEIGSFPVVDQGKDLIGGYTDKEELVLKCSLPVIVFGDHTKAVKLINFKFVPGADGTKVLLPKSIVVPSFLSFYTKILTQKIEDKGYARHYQQIENQVIFLPPLPEQRAIVARIEELFSELDHAIANLKSAQAKLEIYRQAVLKKAFGGGLTEEWRRNNNVPISGKELLKEIRDEQESWIKEETKLGNSEANRLKSKLKMVKSDFSTLEELPFGWTWTTFLESSNLVVDCHNKTAPYQSEGIFLVRTTNVKKGTLNLSNGIKFVSQETFDYWSRRCVPRSGDILFTREAPMGEVAIIPENTKICLGQRMMLIRVFNNLVNKKYLYYAIQNPSFQQRMDKSAIGTGVKHLRVGDVENLIFPICSPEEQTQIVQEIESRLSVADKLAETIHTNLLKSESLRQSILKQAFEGKLLTEAELEACRKEADWEPAEKLLERIKNEKSKK